MYYYHFGGKIWSFFSHIDMFVLKIIIKTGEILNKSKTFNI